MTKTITVDSGGPIEGTFPIDLSKGPGVYEFRGKRGSGKSTCISCIDLLAGHKVDVTLHDGAVSGRVEGFGVVAPIGGKKRRKGDLELDTIDAEKFSITDILDPQGKTPEVRDATRIKAIAVLSETKADPSLYYELAGGQAEFDELGISDTDDPVLLATRIKRAYDDLARKAENTAAAEAKHAAPLEHVPEGLDMEAESDLRILGEHRDHERDEFKRLSLEREAGIEKEAKIAEAKERLEAARSEYTGPTVEEAQAAQKQIVEKGKAAKARVEELKEQLRQAQQELDLMTEQYNSAANAVAAAQSHQRAIEGLESLASESVTYPEQSDVDEAGKRVDVATADYDTGVRIRDLKQNHEKAKAHREAEKVASKAADEARNKAAQVFDILAQSLNTKHLQIQAVDGNPRLFVKHPQRGKTAFDQVNGLSDGERVDFTLKELIPHIDTPGLLPIPQRVWQDLQPSDRANLHALAVEKGLFLFGAQVDDGDLRVVYYGEDVVRGDDGQWRDSAGTVLFKDGDEFPQKAAEEPEPASPSESVPF